MNSVGVAKANALLDGIAVRRLQFAAARQPSQHESFFTCCEIVADFTAATLAPVLAYAGYHRLGLGRQAVYPPFEFIAAACAFAAVVVLLLDREGAYRRGSSLLRVRETERVLRSSMVALMLAAPVSYFAGHVISRWMFALTFVCMPALLIAEKQFFYVFVRWLHERGYGIRRVLIYGGSESGRRVFSALVRSPKLGLHPMAIVDDDPGKAAERILDFSYIHKRSLPVTSGPITRELLCQLRVDEVIVAVPAIPQERLIAVVQEAVRANCSVAFVPNHQLSTEIDIEYSDIDGLMLASFSASSRAQFERWKRWFDFAAATVLLLLLAPLMAAIAVAIRWNSPGRALFVQKRVGKSGKLFDLYKFRTMFTNAPAYHFSPTETSDPRITRIGRCLRRSSLDELPQLLNVIRGDMSLVGPRPEMPFIVQKYKPRERQRLQVRPGITGLWQLSADRAYLIHENIQYDLYYIRNRSFCMDMAILLHTLFFAMRGI